MNAIYLVSRAKITGPTNQALNILKGMKMNGDVNMRFVTLAPEIKDDSRLEDFKDNNIEVVQLLPQKFNLCKSIKLLNKYIKDKNIEIVHSTGYRADLVNRMITSNVKKISTQRCHPKETAEEKPKFLRRFLESFHLWIIKGLDRIVACSVSIQKVYKDEYGMNVSAVQNGVDMNRFFPISNEDKKILRNELGMDDSKKIFLVLGSLIPRKNVGLIIEAFNDLNVDNYQLYIVGGGSDEGLLKELAKANKNIVFTGKTNKPLQYIQTADILISSSLNEGLPNTVLEAMSCGLPSILSDIEPHKELLKQDFLGINFDKNSKNELIDAIKESMNWDLESMSPKIIDYTRSEFDIKSLASKYTDIYKCII